MAGVNDSYVNETKKSPVSSYNLISNHFHENFREKSFKMKRNLDSSEKHKNKLTNGNGGMIIQLRAAIFEIIRNTGSLNGFHLSSILAVFMRFSSLI